MNPVLLSERPVTACLSCDMTQMFLFSASPTPDPGYTVYNAMGTGGSVGRDSGVCVTTRYGLDGPGIESRWGEDFCTRPDLPWGLLYNWVSGSLTRGKVAGAWR